MSERIKAVYENGVFKPLEPVTARDGETAEVLLSTPTEPKPDPATILLEIAERHRDLQPTDVSVNHDFYLYGWDKTA